MMGPSLLKLGFDGIFPPPAKERKNVTVAGWSIGLGGLAGFLGPEDSNMIRAKSD